MSLTQVLEVLGQHRIPVDESVEADLRRALDLFPTARTESISLIKQIQTKDPTQFVLSAARLLGDPELAKSPGSEYVAGVIHNSNCIVEPLLDERVPPETALLLARGMEEAEPLMDARLMRRLIENAQGAIEAIPKDVGLRVPWLLDRFSGCSRVTPYLVQLSRHPSSDVRSKAALLLGRGNLNLIRVKKFMASDDGRIRANAVESLWGMASLQARELFREASADPSRRVAVNALVGLCKAGDRDARTRLIELSDSEDPVSRRAAAWAMGQVADPVFIPKLEALAQSEDKVLHTVAARSLDLINTPQADRRWAARQHESIKPAVPKAEPVIPVPPAMPDLKSYPSRAFAPITAEAGVTPSARDGADTIPDLRSYPLASSSRPGH